MALTVRVEAAAGQVRLLIGNTENDSYKRVLMPDEADQLSQQLFRAARRAMHPDWELIYEMPAR